MFRLITLSFLLISSTISAQLIPYAVFTKDGKAVQFDAVTKESLRSDIIFFGELHDNPIAHWLQFELLKELKADATKKLVAGAEMFEADVQLILDEYLSGKISEKSFLSEARVWPNYKTDYRPLVEFCKSKEIRFIATNVPRRYASMVYLKGLGFLDSLDKQAKAYLPPLPFPYDPELKIYKEIFSGAGHGGANLPLSQALKDAAMGHFIVKNFKKENRFIHFNGSYHSNYSEGIVWYVRKYEPSVKTMVIAVVEQEDLSSLEAEYKGQADFVIVVDKDMTKTNQ